MSRVPIVTKRTRKSAINGMHNTKGFLLEATNERARLKHFIFYIIFDVRYSSKSLTGASIRTSHLLLLPF